MFLRKKDFKPQVRTEVLGIISTFDDRNLIDAEVMGISRMTGYLYTKFDTTLLFAPLVLWAIDQVYAKDTRIVLSAETYVPATAYIEDDLVLFGGKIYACNLPTTGVFVPADWDLVGEDQSLYSVTVPLTTAGTFPTNMVEYRAGDTRTPIVVETLIDIILYLLHGNTGRSQMPIMREERYKAGLDWLRDMRDGLLQDPSIPVRLSSTGTVEGTFFSWGSQKSFDSEY